MCNEATRRGTLAGTLGSIGGLDARLRNPLATDVEDRGVKVTWLSQLRALKALSFRGGAMESVVDAIQGEKRSLSGMVAVDDPRDERVIVFIGHEVALAPDRQGMPAERLPS